MSLTDEQSQELMDTIVAKCEELDLSQEEILDGLGRAIISAALAFGKSSAQVSVEGHGKVEVSTEL